MRWPDARARADDAREGSLPGRTRRGVLALGLGFCLGSGAVALAVGDPSQGNRHLAEAHRARRLPEIRAALADAQPGFVFLAGNSHAELLANALAPRIPVVSGGIGGASARSYAAKIDAMPFPVRARVAVLFVGTNDILRSANPLSEATLGGFAAAVTRILIWLRANADTVLVAAVPPIGAAASGDRDPAAVEAYTAALRRLCAETGCRPVDPFARLRDAGPGLTTQAAPDGVHLRDDAGTADDLAASLRRVGPD